MLKEVHKQLNLIVIEEGDLVRVNNGKSDVEEKGYSIVEPWNWKLQNYFI